MNIDIMNIFRPTTLSKRFNHIYTYHNIKFKERNK